MNSTLFAVNEGKQIPTQQEILVRITPLFMWFVRVGRQGVQRLLQAPGRLQGRHPEAPAVRTRKHAGRVREPGHGHGERLGVRQAAKDANLHPPHAQHGRQGRQDPKQVLD